MAYPTVGPIMALVDGTFVVKLIALPDEHDEMHAYACRGPGKGCDRRREMPCGECLGPMACNTKYRQIVERLREGDA